MQSHMTSPPGEPHVRNWLSVAACAAAALIISLPMLIRCTPAGRGWKCESIAERNSQTDDTRQFVMMWEVSRVSIEDFGELPSWNPYHCGGVIHYLDPQAPFPGPLFFLLYFWVPAVVGIKLWNIAHLVAGALGARKLAKDRGANAPEQLLAATLVVGSGAVAQHMGGGQLWFTPFLLMPWVWWAWERALRDARWAILLAALFALAALEGGVYPVPLMFAALAFDALGRLWRAEERRGLAKAALVFAVLFPLLGAIKLVPVMYFLSGNPRLTPVDDRMTPGEILLAWITRDHARAVAGHIYVWPEYDAYVGLVPVVLLAAAVVIAVARRDRRELPMRQVFVLAALLWCALGDVSPLSLFSALHHLPIFRSLRVPSRFLYPATVVGTMLIVSLLILVRRWATARLEAPWKARAFAGAELLVAVLVLTDLSLATQAKLQQGGDVRLTRRPASADFHLVANANYTEVPDFPIRGIGTMECYGGFDWSVSRALWTGRPIERLEPPDAGSLARVRWSPSSISLHAALTRPATLVVDQNFDPGWRSNLGVPVSRDGLLALPLPAGDHEVRLDHRPQGFWMGALLSLLGVVLSVYALTRRAARPPGPPSPPAAPEATPRTARPAPEAT